MTLAEIIEQVRRRADMENSEFVTDSEITDYINSSATELYDILVGKFEDYYTLDPVPFTINGGETSYTLPSNFYKLRGVDKVFGSGDFAALQKFNFNQRNRRNLSVQRPIVRNTSAQYRLMGNKLLITPADAAPGQYRLWYIPQFAKLVDPTDNLDVIFGWEEYVIIDAAIKCLQKEESDVSVLLSQKQDMLGRIEMMAENRDADLPDTITDIYKAGGFWDEY